MDDNRKTVLEILGKIDERSGSSLLFEAALKMLARLLPNPSTGSYYHDMWIAATAAIKAATPRDSKVVSTDPSSIRRFFDTVIKSKIQEVAWIEYNFGSIIRDLLHSAAKLPQEYLPNPDIVEKVCMNYIKSRQSTIATDGEHQNPGEAWLAKFAIRHTAEDAYRYFVAVNDTKRADTFAQYKNSDVRTS